MKKYISIFLALLQFNLISLFGISCKQESIIPKTPDNYNYVIGTQAICPSYKFTQKSDIAEVEEQVIAMGSNMIKVESQTGKAVYDAMDAYNFKYVFLWFRKDNLHKAVFENGYTAEEAKADYDAIYDFAKSLLTKYNNSGTEFYIGTWESDWYYIDELDENGKSLHADYYTGVQTVSQAKTEAAIQWINNRQKAVDDAKKDTAYENVEVWNYLEVNRVQDAFKKGYDRLINKVVPYTNVDYISYSAYDSMALSAREVRKTINKMNDLLPKKDNVPGPRVFIGEFAKAAAEFNYDDAAFTKANLEILQKYLSANVKFVLFWEMYCNTKLSDGKNKGFWLIDSDGNKTGLYKAYNRMLTDGKAFVTEYQQKHGKLPSAELYRAYLRKHPALYGR